MVNVHSCIGIWWKDMKSMSVDRIVPSKCSQFHIFITWYDLSGMLFQWRQHQTLIMTPMLWCSTSGPQSSGWTWRTWRATSWGRSWRWPPGSEWAGWTSVSNGTLRSIVRILKIFCIIEDCKTFTTQTFTTPDVHHPQCKIRRSPPPPLQFGQISHPHNLI